MGMFAGNPRRKTPTISLNAKAATGAGSTVDFGDRIVRDVRYYLTQASVTTGATIKIEASYDGTTFFVFSSITANANGNTMAFVDSIAGRGMPRYWRANITARTDGTYTLYLGADADY